MHARWTAEAAALLLLSAHLFADVEGDLRSAKACIDEKDFEGAQLLLDRVQRQDPTCARAMTLLASFHDEEATRLPLRCLEEGTPLDSSTAAEVLHSLRGRLIRLPREFWRALERASLADEEAGEQVLDTWHWGDDRPRVPPGSACCGPLRSEAFPNASEEWADALGRIEPRFLCEEVRDARVWAELAVLLCQMGDRDGAERVLGRATPQSLLEEVPVAECRLRVARDPLAEWRATGPSLLARVAATGRRPLKDGDLKELCDRARRTLADAGDLEGILSLLHSESACWDADDFGKAVSLTVTAIGWHWRLDEAYAALHDDDEPVRACLRSALLGEMLQEDLAIETLERALTHHPDDLRLLCSAETLYQRLGDKRRGGIAARRFQEAARAAGTPVERSMDPDRARLDSLLDSCDRDDPHTMAHVIESLDRAAPDPSSSAWYWPNIVDGIVERGRDDVLERLVAHLSPRAADRASARIGCALRVPKERDTFARYLFRLAGRVRFDPATEAFLAAALADSEGAEIDAAAHLSLRRELMAHPGFLSLPSARWILSLTFDPVLQMEEARSLRAKALCDGCRAQGLLSTCARESGAGMDLLREVDPIEARLIEAERAGDTGALAGVAADPDATREQREEACVQLAQFAWAKEGRVRIEVDRRAGWRSAAWALAELTQCGARGAASLFNEESGLSPALRQTLVDALMEGGLADPSALHDVAAAVARTVEEAARLSQDHDYWWNRAVARIVEAGPAGTGRAFLQSAAGLRAVEALRDSPGLLEEVRRQEDAHPLDLRWTVAEADLLEHGAQEGDPARRIGAVAAHQRRNARVRVRDLSDAQGAEGVRRFVRAYLAEFGSEGISEILGQMREAFSGDYDPERRSAALESLALAADDDWQRRGVSTAAREAGRDDLSAHLDSALQRSADLYIRLEAMIRSWERDPGRARGEEILDGLRRLEPPSWKAGMLLGLFADAAVRREDAETALDAWAEGWELGAMPGWTCVNGDLRDELGEKLLRWPLLRKTLEARLDGGGSPAPLWLLAARMDPAARDDAWRRLDPVRWIHLEGFISEEEWTAACVALPRVELFARWNGVLAATRPGPPCYLLRDRVESLARALQAAGRGTDAAECVDAWAARCGTLDSSQRRTRPRMWDLGFGGCRMVNPLSWDAVEMVPQSPEVLSAHVLSDLAMCREAIDRLGGCAQRAGRETDLHCPSTCARVGLLLREKRFEEAARDLCGIVGHSNDQYSERAVRYELQDLYSRHPETHVVFVERLLAQPDDRAAPRQEDVDEWEAELCSPRVEARAEATERLRALGRNALPLLRALRDSRDPEARARANEILEELAEPRE